MSTSKVMTRSETAKMSITESHRRDGCTEDGWNAFSHNGKCYEDDEDIEEYHRPCRCCIAQLFRKEGRDNPCNVACRICFNWKGNLLKSFTRID
jgi:hypothetical protein